MMNEVKLNALNNLYRRLDFITTKFFDSDNFIMETSKFISEWRSLMVEIKIEHSNNKTFCSKPDFKKYETKIKTTCLDFVEIFRNMTYLESKHYADDLTPENVQKIVLKIYENIVYKSELPDYADILAILIEKIYNIEDFVLIGFERTTYIKKIPLEEISITTQIDYKNENGTPSVPDEYTSEEVEFLNLLKSGEKFYEIAKIMHMSERTLRRNIFNPLKLKMEVENKAEALKRYKEKDSFKK